MNRPKLLLADEPTSNLDDESCAAVADLLLSATQRHAVSLVIATHDTRLKAKIPRQLALPRRPAETSGMNLLQLAWSYLRARPLGTLLNVLLLALGVGTIGFVLIVNGQIGDSLNRDAQGHRPRGRRQGQPDPADARRDLSPRRADRQHPAQVRAGARQESADPARDSAVHRRQLPRLLDRRHHARLHRPLPRQPSHPDEPGTTGCRRCWARRSRLTPGLASAIASSARTASPKADRCTATRSIRSWAS